MKLNGMPLSVTRAVKRIVCNVSHPGSGTNSPAATKAVQAIGHEAVPRFFWGSQAARAKAEHRWSPDPDGWLARFVAAM